jgi:hypothetical protein
VRSIDPRDDAAHGESVTNVIGQDEKGSVREPHHQAAHSSNPTKAGRPMRVARPVRVAGHRRAWISTEASSQRLQGLLERHVDTSSPHRGLRPPSPTLLCPTSSSYQCSGLPWIARTPAEYTVGAFKFVRRIPPAARATIGLWAGR